MSEHVIGIDLGTTNSEVAVYLDGKVEVLTLDNGTQMLPSVVGLDEQGALLVGTEARNQLVLYPERTVCAIKRKMGTDERVTMGDSAYRPQEISAMILKKLKQAAEQRLGEPVSKAVITVPAQFTDAQRHATREAGQIAGLEVLRILNEPTAACLAYENGADSRARKLLAFDLGGGTFDVSVVRMEGEVMEVIASNGDNALGGNDFDMLSAQWLLSQASSKSVKLDELTAAARYRLLKAAEHAKRQLTSLFSVQVIEPHVVCADGKAVPVDEEMTRLQFEELIDSAVQAAMGAVRKCLLDARLRADEIDDVILVGGSTRSPIFADALKHEFGIQPHQDIQPDLAVAYGAGVMAARLMGKEMKRILVDITPFAFGISSLGELENGELTPYCFSQVIPAGSPLPFSREEPFCTVCDGQERAEINVYEGSNEDARKNTLIGTFAIEGLADVPAESIIVLFMKLDLDGLLTVSATEKDTGLSKQIVIDHARAKMSAEQKNAAAERIDRLFQAGQQGVTEEKPGKKTGDSPLNSKLSALKRRLQKVNDSLDEVDREDAGMLLQKLQEAVDQNDEAAFENSARELEDILFFAEG